MEVKDKIEKAEKNEPIMKVEDNPKKKEKLELERFDEIENLVQKAIGKNDVDTVLFLNELTLARNLEIAKRFKQEFKVVSVAFKKDDGIVKRAGVYNVNDFTDSEMVEDILISEDLTNNKVLAVPRHSVFISQLK